jgi:hypothetical protein
VSRHCDRCNSRTDVEDYDDCEICGPILLCRECIAWHKTEENEL